MQLKVLIVERVSVLLCVVFVIWWIEVEILKKLRIFVVAVAKKFSPLVEACPIKLDFSESQLAELFGAW